MARMQGVVGARSFSSADDARVVQVGMALCAVKARRPGVQAARPFISFCYIYEKPKGGVELDHPKQFLRVCVNSFVELALCVLRSFVDVAGVIVDPDITAPPSPVCSR